MLHGAGNSSPDAKKNYVCLLSADLSEFAPFMTPPRSADSPRCKHLTNREGSALPYAQKTSAAGAEGSGPSWVQHFGR